MSPSTNPYAIGEKIVGLPWENDPDLAAGRLDRLWRKSARAWRPTQVVTALHRLAKFAPARADAGLVTQLAHSLRRDHERLEARGLTSAAWALAVLGARDAELLTALAAVVLRRGPGADREFCLTAWSLAVGTAAGALGPPVLADFVRRVPHAPAWAAGLPVRSLMQLHHAGLLIGHHFPGRVATRIAEQLEVVRLCPPAPRGFELEVGRVLAGLGLVALPQTFFEGYFIDFLVEVPGGPVALECAGVRYHRPGTGGDVLKDALLARAGVRVVRVMDSEWAAAPDRHFLAATRLGLL